jgi:DNA-binding CsgD family transcriptional regulator
LDEVRPEVTSYRVVLAPKTIGPSVLAAILHQGATGHADGTLTRFARNYRLTSKESEVLGRVARGDSPKQTAAYLECSVQAVYVHLAGVCSKTACSSYHQVMAKLFQFSCHSLGHDERTRREAGTARLTTPLSQQDTGAAPSR